MKLTVVLTPISTEILRVSTKIFLLQQAPLAHGVPELHVPVGKSRAANGTVVN